MPASEEDQVGTDDTVESTEKNSKKRPEEKGDVFNCSIKNLRETSHTSIIGGSFRSDKDPTAHACDDETGNIEKSKLVSLIRLYSMIGPYWAYGVLGTLTDFITEALMLLFA
ncbi:hypothetical protein KIW84_040447 [Lathyrus oleraceus]|uniref:Uncharacterized protein n=1 Tax=Pisum sativum TaxID=3888 RepID=A0A9D5AQ35_PEA|nr:hypothetical protein KIW84_040447 [Pisum sativum]